MTDLTFRLSRNGGTQHQAGLIHLRKESDCACALDIFRRVGRDWNRLVVRPTAPRGSSFWTGGRDNGSQRRAHHALNGEGEPRLRVRSYLNASVRELVECVY